MRAIRIGLLTSVLLAASFGGARTARAADPVGNDAAAAAESLFQEGRKLVDAKRYDEACPKFAASQKLAPGVGTLLNLADCYEKNNQIASAWSHFNEAAAFAQRLGKGKRERTARERADKLEPRLIRLSIMSRSAVGSVTLDGNDVVLGTPIPIDSGKHVVEATAKGKKSFSTTVDVTEKTKSPSVEIPILEDETAVAISPHVEPSLTKKENPPHEKTRSWSTQKTMGVAVAGAGVIGLGVGAIFGLRTSSRWKEAQTHCDDSLNCDADGVDLAAQAKQSGRVSTIAFIAGSALVAGGAVLFFTAKPRKIGESPSSVRIGASVGSLVLGGSF